MPQHPTDKLTPARKRLLSLIDEKQGDTKESVDICTWERGFESKDVSVAFTLFQMHLLDRDHSKGSIANPAFWITDKGREVLSR